MTRAFRGHAMVRVLETVPGAVLLERITPATLLVDVVRAGNDDAATAILADVMAQLREGSVAAAADLGTPASAFSSSFTHALETPQLAIARSTLEDAAARYDRLCATQSAVQLLHGDLQHYNVLEDSRRGWVAIDPKGIRAETEYEIGAMLRNPFELPNVFATRRTVERRILQLSDQLRLNSALVAEWGYAQGILSALWSIEDEDQITPAHAGLLLASIIRPLLD